MNYTNDFVKKQEDWKFLSINFLNRGRISY